MRPGAGAAKRGVAVRPGGGAHGDDGRPPPPAWPGGAASAAWASASPGAAGAGERHFRRGGGTDDGPGEHGGGAGEASAIPERLLRANFGDTPRDNTVTLDFDVGPEESAWAVEAVPVEQASRPRPPCRAQSCDARMQAAAAMSDTASSSFRFYSAKFATREERDHVMLHEFLFSVPKKMEYTARVSLSQCKDIFIIRHRHLAEEFVSGQGGAQGSPFLGKELKKAFEEQHSRRASSETSELEDDGWKLD